jgi:hypothetical protein
MPKGYLTHEEGLRCFKEKRLIYKTEPVSSIYGQVVLSSFVGPERKHLNCRLLEQHSPVCSIQSRDLRYLVYIDELDCGIVSSSSPKKKILE